MCLCKYVFTLYDVEMNLQIFSECFVDSTGNVNYKGKQNSGKI